MINWMRSALKRPWLLCCVAALVVACLVFFLHDCSSKQNKDPRVGSYSLLSLTVDGMEDLTLPQSKMDQYSLSLRKNGTGTLIMESGFLPLTWDDEYFYDPEGARKAYTYEDGVLSFQNGSVFMVFLKQDQPETKN